MDASFQEHTHNPDHQYLLDDSTIYQSLPYCPSRSFLHHHVFREIHSLPCSRHTQSKWLCRHCHWRYANPTSAIKHTHQPKALNFHKHRQCRDRLRNDAPTGPPRRPSIRRRPLARETQQCRRADEIIERKTPRPRHARDGSSKPTKRERRRRSVHETRDPTRPPDQQCRRKKPPRPPNSFLIKLSLKATRRHNSINKTPK